MHPHLLRFLALSCCWLALPPISPILAHYLSLYYVRGCSYGCVCVPPRVFVTLGVAIPRRLLTYGEQQMSCNIQLPALKLSTLSQLPAPPSQLPATTPTSSTLFSFYFSNCALGGNFSQLPTAPTPTPVLIPKYLPRRHPSFVFRKIMIDLGHRVYRVLQGRLTVNPPCKEKTHGLGLCA
jgi:hypothetical protein